MANPYVNKVVYDGNTLIDLTADTVTADKLAKNYTAHSASGQPIVGTMEGGGGTVWLPFCAIASTITLSMSTSLLNYYLCWNIPKVVTNHNKIKMDAIVYPNPDGGSEGIEISNTFTYEGTDSSGLRLYTNDDVSTINTVRQFMIPPGLTCKNTGSENVGKIATRGIGTWTIRRMILSVQE